MSQHCVVGVFERESDILRATATARDLSLRIVDVYTPYEVHGIDRVLGLHRSRLPWACFFCGFIGVVLAWWFQYWTLALDWPLDGGLGVASNVGLTYVSDGGEQFAEASFSLALGADLGGAWGGYIEYYNSIPESAGGDDRHFANTGLTFLVSSDFQLDARVGFEIGGETDYFVGVGLSYRW